MNFKKLPKQEEVDEFNIGNLEVKLVKNTSENREHTMSIIRAMYESEPCRICGEKIGDTSKAVYAGYSHDNKSRSAHKICWNSGIPKKQWAFPLDSNDR